MRWATAWASSAVFKRVDDHPLCKRCGFDLIGKPAESCVCSECGADLSAAGAITIGHRERKTGLLVGGIVTILLAITLGTVVTVYAYRTVDWVKIAPLSYLKYEASHGSPAGQSSALTEIERRLTNKELGAAQIDTIVDRALERQADAGTPWNPQWGNLVEDAHENGALAPAKWDRYIKQATPTFGLIVRPIVARGDRLPVQLTQSAPRVASSGRLESAFNSDNARYWIDDIPLSSDRNASGSTRLAGGGYLFGNVLELWPTQRQLKNGKHRVRITCDITIRERYGDLISDYATVPCDVAGDFAYVPTANRSVKIVSDPTFRNSIEASLRVVSVAYSGGDHPYFRIESVGSSAALPVGLGFQMFIVANGKEWKSTSLARPAGRTTSDSWTSISGAQGFDAASEKFVDVVLRPDAKVAAETLNSTEIWNGEITFKHIPVALKTDPPRRLLP